MINKTMKGDLIDLAKKGYFDAIAHGCNCFCTMGAGIALQIKNNFPEAHQEDLDTPYGDMGKLGKFSMALTNYMGISGNLAVLNLYTQYGYHGKDLADLQAIRKVFTDLNIRFKGDTLGIPKIGAGLAGGNWEEISAIINEVTPDLNIILVEYVK